MKYQAFQDKNVPGDWRVEAVDFQNEGNVYIAIFSGPGAKERAQEYVRWKNNIQQHAPILKAS